MRRDGGTRRQGCLEEELLAVDWGGFVKSGEGIGLHSMYILVDLYTELSRQEIGHTSPPT